MQEIIKLQEGLKNELANAKPQYVCMEGHAFGSRYLTYAFGELGFAYHRLLLNYNTFIIPPTTIKKFITDNGRASKEEVADSIRREAGLEFDDLNLSDACACAFAAMVASGYKHIFNPEALHGQRAYMGDDHKGKPS